MDIGPCVLLIVVFTEIGLAGLFSECGRDLIIVLTYFNFILRYYITYWTLFPGNSGSCLYV